MAGKTFEPALARPAVRNTRFMNHYNEIRPHMSCYMKPPGQVGRGASEPKKGGRSES
ncbi:MAG: hypothetical protein WD267_01045 [Balneolales bacterium]